MQKSKLVIIQPALGRYRKGFVEELVDLNMKEFDIRIYCSPVDNLGVKSIEKIDSSIIYVKSRMLSFLGLFFWQCFFTNIISLRLNHKDVFVFNGNPRFLSSLILAFFMKYRGVDVIWWGHGRSSTSSRLGSYVRYKLMNLFRIILYTDLEVSQLRTVVKSPMIGLNNGLDVKAIRLGYEFNTEKYDDFYLNLAFIGRLTKKSNFNLLLESLLIIPDSSLTRLRLNVIGNVSLKYITEMYPRLENCQIKCFGEVYDESEVTSILSKCHVFVYPGSVGLSIIHAFALGLPAIVHDNIVAHMPEIGCFKDSFNGLSFKYNSVTSLGSKIEKVILDRSLLKVLSLNAYNTVSDTFNTHDMASRFLSFIRNRKCKK